MKYFANITPFPPPELPDAYAKAFLGSLVSRGKRAVPPDEHELAPMLSPEDSRSRSRLQSAAAWVRMTEILRPALEQIAISGQRVWAWKGLDYAESLYDSPSHRPMCDMDIMVEHEFLQGVLNILLDHGWKISSKTEYLFTSGIVSELKLRRSGVLLEIHTHPLFFPATLTGSLPGDIYENGRILRPGMHGFRWEYALLLSLLHHCLQIVSRQVWWIDESLLIRKIWTVGGDWKLFARWACETGFEWEIGELLGELSLLPGVDLPSGLLSLLRATGKAPSRRLRLLRGPRGWATVQNAISLTGWRRFTFLCDWCLRSTGIAWLHLKGRTGESQEKRGRLE